MSILILVVFAIAYLSGSIPFGYLIAKVWNIDIRSFGSGNIGATNVFRTLGPIPGLMAFALDLLKGAFPVYLIQQITNNPWLIILTGLAAVLGHTFPIFLKFKGGRGAATGLGILLAIAPDIFCAAILMALLVLFITRYVSVTSMLTTMLVTIALIVLKRPLPYSLAAGLISILIIIRHKPNIKRLINKTEPKIGENQT